MKDPFKKFVAAAGLMKVRTLVFLMLCCLVTPGMAEVYQTKDEDGNITYTDVPPTEGAPEVELPPVNVFKAPREPVESSLKSSAKTADEFKYQKLEILSPPDNETIFINTTKISIEIKVFPGINRGANHRLQILWDGQVLAENQLTYQIEQAERGEHTIKAQIVDQNNQVLISATSVVHVKQPF
jgi:hypothetical protein